MNSKLSFKILVGILLGLLIISEIFLGVLTYRAQLKAERTLLWLKQSFEVVEKLDAISLFYSGDFSGLTPDSMPGNFAEPDLPLSEREAIRMLLGEIGKLVADNPEQAKQAETLEGLIEEQWLLSDSIQGKSDSSLPVDSAESLSFLNRNTGIEELLLKMKLVEKRLLGIREVANQQSMRSFSTAFYLLLAGMGLVVFVTFISIKLYFERGIRLQKEIKKVGQLYEKFFYDSPVGMMIVRKSDGLVIDSNRSYSELVSCPLEEIVGHPPAILDGTGDIERYKSQFTSEPSFGKVLAVELQLKPKDRAPVFTSVSIQSLLVKGDPCMLLVVQDMSLYKKAETEMRKALDAEIEVNKMKTDFITLASHEFRTPLSTVLSSAFLIESWSRTEGSDIPGKYLDRIRSSVSTMTFLVDEFLILTGIEKRGIQVKSDLVDIKKHMEELLKSFDPLLKAGQQILYEHEGDKLVYTDPAMIEKMVNILVSNSVKFSGENSQILILTKVKDGFFIRVKDFGLGIPEEDLHRLFQRFFKASNADHIQGLGLGLYIMKHYVDMLQGKVRIRSNPEEGTEVIISFDSTDD